MTSYFGIIYGWRKSWFFWLITLTQVPNTVSFAYLVYTEGFYTSLFKPNIPHTDQHALTTHELVMLVSGFLVLIYIVMFIEMSILQWSFQRKDEWMCTCGHTYEKHWHWDEHKCNEWYRSCGCQAFKRIPMGKISR